MAKEAQLDSDRAPEPNVTATANTSRLLTPDEVARQTGLSVETLAQWRSQRRGPDFVKISRNFVRYRQCDLDGWLAERIVRTHQDSSDRR
jgi:predicted DNA-binding transcriptional regulator AlpA